MKTESGDKQCTLASPSNLAWHRRQRQGRQCQSIRDTSAPSRASPDWTRQQLLDALNDYQFSPHYQPQFELATGRIIGVELLARWHHPTLGVVTPDQFIAPMEGHGLVGCLTAVMLRHAVGCAHACAAQGHTLRFAINFSPLTLRDARTPRQLASLLANSGLQPEQITIEMTESESSHAYPVVAASLARLRAIGFHIAIDDFGTGHSSLSMLNTMPFTELKIDRSFVAAHARTSKTPPILQSIVQLADKLGLRTVAEGIETEAELDFVRALGCEYGQGYLLARPMPQTALLHLLTTGARPEPARPGACALAQSHN